MKKTIVIMLLLAVVALSALGFAACNICEHTLLEHHKEIAASCETEGIMEYWFCIECGQYFEDELATKKVAYSKLTIPVLGHDLQDVEEVSQTCTEPGYTAGQKCSRCDYTTVWTIPASHDMTYHAEVPATCTEDGTKEHWTCSHEDGVYYVDEAGTAKLDDVTLYATGHNTTYNAGIPATCTGEGMKEYWTCWCDENVYYANEEGTEILDDLTIDPIGHAMTYRDYQAATCTEDGHFAHWACAHEEGVYYADEKATEALDSSSIVIPAIGHSWKDEWELDETYHWHECNNGCGEQGSKENHCWDDGEVLTEPTTKSDGEMLYNCEACGETKTEIIPMLNAFTFEVIEQDIYQGEDGGSINIETDIPFEDNFCVEGTVVTVTVTLNEGFGIGSIYLNNKLFVDSPLVANNTYTFSFVMEENTTLTVEFGKLVTAKRTWKLYDNGTVGYPWELYTVDAAQDGHGTAMLLAFDATGIGDARAHDFTTDTVFTSYKLDGTVSWSNINKQIKSAWIAMTRQLPEEERQFDITLAFAIRLLPSAAKRASGYVASALVLPVDTTSEGKEYGMTMEYTYSKADLTATNVPQIRFTSAGDYLEFIREDGAGSVFNTYHAAYIEVEIRKGDEVYYAYMFAEGNQLCMYSTLDKSGLRLACGSITNAYITMGTFTDWAMKAYDIFFYASSGWELRTKVHVDENSLWCYDGEWSKVIKYEGFDYDAPPSFAQFNFTAAGDYFEFLRTGGKGVLFTQYNAAYVEIEMKKGDVTYYMYLFNVGGEVYLYSNVNMEGEGLHCNGVGDAYVTTSAFNTWASKVFEPSFKALEWEYRTKVHVDENSVWDTDGEWSDVIKYGA